MTKYNLTDLSYVSDLKIYVGYLQGITIAVGRIEGKNDGTWLAWAEIDSNHKWELEENSPEEAFNDLMFALQDFLK